MKMCIKAMVNPGSDGLVVSNDFSSRMGRGYEVFGPDRKGRIAMFVNSDSTVEQTMKNVYDTLSRFVPNAIRVVGVAPVRPAQNDRDAYQSTIGVNLEEVANV